MMFTSNKPFERLGSAARPRPLNDGLRRFLRALLATVRRIELIARTWPA